MKLFSILNPLDQPSGDTRVLDYLREGFQNEEFSRATLIVAFTKSGPLRRLRSDIESWTRNDSREVRAIFGIDLGGTSEEALRLSLELFDEVHILHQRGIGTTFHPKIYYFEGKESFSAYVGSNNLTTGGLETNFESGVRMELSSPEHDPLKHEFYECWEDTVDVARRLDESLLGDLVDEGLVPTEESIQPTTSQTHGKGQNEEEDVPEFPEINSQPASFLPQAGSDAGQQDDGLTGDPNLVWRKRNLKARDSQRPGSGTNPSGVITLVQDYFTVDGESIDKTTYYRNDVFGRLNWWEEETKEVAIGTFEVSIEGESYGVHKLRISHDPDWESGQDNYTTALHWGPLNETLRNDVDIRGLNFYLFDLGNEQWRIEIREPNEES